MLAIRGVAKGLSNYMVFDPAVGPWRTVHLGEFAAQSGTDENGNALYEYTNVFSTIYDFNPETGTARFPTGVRIKLDLLNPDLYFSYGPGYPVYYPFQVFNASADEYQVNGEPWRLVELDLQGSPFREIRVANNGLNYLNVSGCNKLVALDCALNNLTDSTLLMEGAGEVYSSEYGSGVLFETLIARSNNLSVAPFIQDNNHEVVFDYDVANNQIETIQISGFPPVRLDVSGQFPNDPTRGLTSLSFSTAEDRPSLWYVQNNKLTSLSLGVSGGVSGVGWGSVRELNCSNNSITELVFPDGIQVPGTSVTVGGWLMYIPPREEGGYQLITLDVSGNQLTSLDLTHVVTLLDANISDNPIASLALPQIQEKTFLSNQSGVLDANGDDLITGEWRNLSSGYGSTTNDPRVFRHYTGVRKLAARNVALQDFPQANIYSIEELDLRGCANLQTIPLGLMPPAASQWYPFTAVTTNRLYFQTSVNLLQGDVVVFRNLTGQTGVPVGGRPVRPWTGYMVNQTGQMTSGTYGSGFSVVPKSSHRRTLFGPSIGELTDFVYFNWNSGEVMVHRGYTDRWARLSKLQLDNCPELRAMDLRYIPMLEYVTVDGSPKLQGTIINNQTGSTTSTGSSLVYSSHITNLQLRNTGPISPVRLRTSGLYSEFDRVLIDGRSLGSPANAIFELGGFSGLAQPGDPSSFHRCRNGLQFRNIDRVNLGDLSNRVLSRLGLWDYNPTFPTDSNVIDFTGTIAVDSASWMTTYTNAKNTAISRGWQVIDPIFV